MADLSRHPLAVVVVGFLLTGVVGTFLSNRITERQRDRERFLQITDARRTAIQDFARTLYERRARTDMLASSLRRHAPENELSERKRLYDEIYVRWEKDLQPNLFMIRSAMESDDYTTLEGDVESKLAPLLRQLDTCITVAYDARLQGGNPSAQLSSCRYQAVLSASRDCAYAITDQLFRIAVRTAPPSPLEASELRRRAASTIQAACGAA